MIKIRKQNNGFTLIELLIVIAIIGILASIVMISLNSSRNKAYTAKTILELKSLRNGISIMENDVYKWPNGCAIDATSNPETDLTSVNAGLMYPPTVYSSGTCSWTASDIASWHGPYAQFATDHWGHAYVFDPDYHFCTNNITVANPVIVSYGPNGIQNYPAGATQTGDACTDTTSDDIYVILK